MNAIRFVFFGSTTDSILVLEKLCNRPDLFCAAVVTQPHRPVGRKQVLTPTPVESWATDHAVTCLSFPTRPDKPWEYENEQSVINSLQSLKADLIVSASYGQKIPAATLRDAKFGGLNVHPSLLPRWRGTDPVPWTILSDDRQTGVTIVTLSDKFDQGKIIGQKKISVASSDTTPLLREKLFTIGADLLVGTLSDYLSGKKKGSDQKIMNEPNAQRLTRDDGFEPWEILTDPKEASRMNRKFRALHPWPGLWTRAHDKRLKILSFGTSPELVQVEGKKPTSWKQFTSAYFSS